MSSLFLLALVVTCIVMIATWLYANRIDNYGVVDAAWCFSFTLHAALFASLGQGWGPRRVMAGCLLGFWSLRLGSYLAKRIASHHPEEDTRYQSLRKEYEPRIKFRFFWFFQYQAWSVSLLSLGFLWAAQNETAEFSPLEIAGVVVAILAVIGEGIADSQMKAFKAIPANKGQICEVGLWRYSRHPNYFFESCIWWGFFIFFMGSPGSLFLVYAPLVILFLLLKVTGVPPTEKQSLISRGEKYRDYQKRVSVFIPWFPKAKSP